MAAGTATEHTLALLGDIRNNSLKHTGDTTTMRATWLKNSIRIRLLLEEIKRIDGKLVTALMLHVVGQRHRRRYHGETTMHGTDRRQGIWQVIFVKKTLVGWAPMEDMDMMDKKWEGTSHRRWDYQHHGEGAPVTAVDQIRKIAGLLPEPPRSRRGHPLPGVDWEKQRGLCRLPSGG